jgi:hypothetical protein
MVKIAKIIIIILAIIVIRQYDYIRKRGRRRTPADKVGKDGI